MSAPEGPGRGGGEPVALGKGGELWRSRVMSMPPHILDRQRDPACDEGGHEEVDLREQLREEREDPEGREPRHALAQVAHVPHDQPDRLHHEPDVEEHGLARRTRGEGRGRGRSRGRVRVGVGLGSGSG